MTRRHGQNVLFSGCRPGRLAALVAVLGLLVLTAPAAAAHGGGGAAQTIKAGPYLVYVYDGEPGMQPETIRYTLIVRDAETGSPVDGATVQVSGKSTGTTETDSKSVGPVTANGVANVYEYALPDLGETPWKVRATIEAASGTASTKPFTLHGPKAAPPGDRTADRPATSAAVSWLVWLGLAAVLAIVVLTLVAVSSVRRRPSSAADPTST